MVVSKREADRLGDPEARLNFMLGAPKASMKELEASFLCERVEPGEMVKRLNDTSLKVAGQFFCCSIASFSTCVSPEFLFNSNTSGRHHLEKPALTKALRLQERAL